MPPCFAAASALSLTALKPNPGGSMRPFCEQQTVTSTPHSACRYSIEASDEMVSTINIAPWRARSMAWRMSGMRLATPPVAWDEIDGQAEALGHLLPQRGEVTRLEHEHFVARLERVDDGGLPRAGAGRREDDHRPLRAEDRPETLGDLRREARELRAAVVDRGPIDRTQDSIGDVGRSGDLEEVPAALAVHGRRRFDMCILHSAYI